MAGASGKMAEATVRPDATGWGASRWSRRRLSRADLLRALMACSAAQDGYFTARQAKDAGWSRQALSHHARTGFLTRVARGLYRVSAVPESPLGDVIAAWLLAGQDQAVVSHYTALEILGLADTRSDKVHLTVPWSRRPRRPPALPWVVIHTTSRPPGSGEITRRGPLPVTSPGRTIADLAEMEDAGSVWHAVATALRTGMASAEEIRLAAANRRPSVRRLVDSTVLRVLTAQGEPA